MDVLTDSTTITNSKRSNHFQPCSTSSTPSYSHVDCTPVGYAVPLGSTHQHKQQSSADEPRLSGCSITPSPSNSASSYSIDETSANKEAPFRPVDFETLTGRQGSHHIPARAVRMLPTPSDSAESSDRLLPIDAMSCHGT